MKNVINSIGLILVFIIICSFSEIKSNEQSNRSCEKKKESYKEVVAKLVKPNYSDKCKAKAIFTWIATNIKYDYEGFDSGYWKQFESDEDFLKNTFNQRKGICTGYSILFQCMCKEAGLEAVLIDGYARDKNYLAGKAIKSINHSWNAVKIGGEWRLVDVTWAATNSIKGNVNDYYFLTPPDEFGINHYPEENKWQLTNNIIDKDEFDSYPYVSYKYYSLGFNKGFSKVGYVKNNTGSFILYLEAPKDYQKLIKIYSYKDKKWIKEGYTVKKEERDKLVVQLENRGSFMLEVSAAFNNDGQYVINKGLLYYNIDYSY